MLKQIKHFQTVATFVSLRLAFNISTASYLNSVYFLIHYITRFLGDMSNHPPGGHDKVEHCPIPALQ